jgi:hypothetical protein
LVSRSPTAALAAALTLMALGVAGCGSDSGSGTSTDVQSGGAATASGGAVLPPTTAASTTPPAATETATQPTPPPTAAPSTTATGPESQPGGAGDEQPSVIPATFTFGDLGPRPERVEVPPFFTIRVTGVANDRRPHQIVFQSRTIDIPAGKTRSATFPGLKPGTYPVEIDGDPGTAHIVATTDAAGP